MLGIPALICFLMTGILGYMGLHVIKRDIIFIDIAMAQIAALAAIAAHMVMHVHADSTLAFVCIAAATTTAALFFVLVRRYITQLPIEAVIGITYAIATAGALFMIGKSASGHTHIQEMLVGNLLWATWQDVLWCSMTFAIVAICFWLSRRPFEAISDDYDKVLQQGMRVIWWDFFFYSLCGIVIAVAVRIAGVMVVFSFLVIPATASAFFSAKWPVRLLLTWSVGATASVMGLIFCNWQDFSAGTSVALFLGIILIVLSIFRVIRPDKTVKTNV